MGNKDKECSSEKRKKKFKHHKAKRIKIEKTGKSNDSSLNLSQESAEIGNEDERNNTPVSLLRSQDSFSNEENVDIEVEQDIAEDSVEADVNIEEDQEITIDNTRLDKPTSSKKDVPKESTEVTGVKTGTATSTTNQKKSKKRRDSGTSSEEERWLSAVESGKLEEIEDVELRKIKDPKLMTARQRAMYDRNNDTESAPGFTETLLALPTGYKEKGKPQTAEEIQKAALKLLRRRQQADEKREKDKKKTMERLLKKQENKHRIGNKPKSLKESVPMISYKNTLEGATIQLPVGVDFPLQAQPPKDPPKPQMCGISGCGNTKVYNCSKTNLPLCSFACYRKNVQSLRDIIC